MNLDWSIDYPNWLQRWQSVAKQFSTTDLKNDLEALEVETNQPDFWENVEKATQVSQTLAQKKSQLERFWSFDKKITEFPDWAELLAEEPKTLQAETNSLVKELESWETLCWLQGEHDQADAMISINTGNGGQDAEDFSQLLLRMVQRWAEEQQFSAEILYESYSEVGLKSALLVIRGLWAYGYAQGFHGVHRLIRQSPFNAKDLRQTSFARLEVWPVIKEKTALKIDPELVRVDVFRSSGKGGQSVNTTDSAVRLTYLPLGLSVSCQNQRSQLQNKTIAWEILLSRLQQLQQQQQAEKLSELRGELMDNSFGSQVCTYTLHPYQLLKDHRSQYESTNPKAILDGNCQDWLQAYLQWKASTPTT